MDYTKPFRYISEIAQCQSISAAAEKLNIQQPALSKYLKKVENELNAELFDRSTSPIALTEAGRCYLSAAQKVIDADNQLQKQISEMQNNDITIRVGISPSRAPYLLPVILNSFFTGEQHAHIAVFEGTTSELNASLAQGNLDLTISLLEDETKDFEHVELFRESVFLAVENKHRDLSFKEAFDTLDIIASGKGQLLTDLLDILPEHSSLIECQNSITALQLVRADLGAALVPSYMADYGNTESISFIPLPEALIRSVQRTICVFYRKEQFLSSAEREFIRCSVSATGMNK